MEVLVASFSPCRVALRAGKVEVVPLLGWTVGIRKVGTMTLLNPSARAEGQDDFLAKSTMVPGLLKERPCFIRLSHSVCK